MDTFGLRRLEKMLRFYFMIEEVFRGCGVSLSDDVGDDFESKGVPGGHFSHILTREDGLALHWWLSYTHSSSERIEENNGFSKIECGARLGYPYSPHKDDPVQITKHNSGFVFPPSVTIGCRSRGKIYADLDTRTLGANDKHVFAFKGWFFTLRCEGNGCEDGERSYSPPRKNAERYAHQMLTTMGVFFEQMRE